MNSSYYCYRCCVRFDPLWKLTFDRSPGIKGRDATATEVSFNIDPDGDFICRTVVAWRGDPSVMIAITDIAPSQPVPLSQLPSVVFPSVVWKAGRTISVIATHGLVAKWWQPWRWFLRPVLIIAFGGEKVYR